jgi:general secretion pathway protein D
VHENGDVSLHVVLEISSVTGTKSLGGIDEPIIGQRKIEHDIRLREGEVSLLGGLLSLQDSKVKTGTPGLSSIPLLGRLFSGENVDRERDELMVALVPHVVRRPDITPENIRGVDTGPSTQVSVRFKPKAMEPDFSVPAGDAAQPVAPNPAPATSVPAEPAPPATAPPENPSTDPAVRTSRIRFNEAQVEKKVGESFMLTLLVEGAVDVTSAPCTIRFDPNMLSLEDVAPGNFWGSDAGSPTVVKSIQNDIGQASVRFNRKPGNPGAAGLGTLLTLKFKALRSGTAAVEASNITLSGSQNQMVGSANSKVVIAVQ